MSLVKIEPYIVDETGNFTFNQVAVTSNISASNANLGNLTTANYFSGVLTTASQPNITSTGTLSSLSVTGNANVGNIGAAAGVFTANVSANNLSTTNKVTAGNGLQVTTGALTVLSGNLDVTGNLNVTGNVNYSNVSDLVVGDPLIYIGEDNTGDTVDLGIVGSYNNGSYLHTGIARNAATDYWTFFDGVASEPTTVIDWANATYPTVKMGALLATSTVTGTQLISNIATGTAPLVVTSTTQVANLSVATAGLATYATTANAVAGANVSGAVAYATTANSVAGANVSGTVSSATTAGTVTTAAQPNITSVGTLTSLGVNGTITASAITANTGIFTGNGAGLTNLAGGNVTGAVAYATTANSVAGANVSGTVSSATTAGTVTTAAQPNITSVGTLTSVTISGNANVGNLGSSGLIVATGNVTGGNLVTGGALSVTGNANLGNLETAQVLASANVTAPQLISNVATGTAPLVVTSTTQVANLNAATAGLATYATTANAVAGANVSGAVGLATYATTANAVAGANVSGEVSYAATANAVAGANVSGAVSYATTANAVAGANVSGAVGLATYATTANAVAGANVSGAVSYATTANSVAGANVSGAVSYATTANSVAGANVSGAVSYATTANSVAGANVSGTVSSATTAGTVTTAAQPNITSVGTLSGVTATGTINLTGASNVSLGAVGNLHITGGSANNFLKTDGSGTLSWGTPGGGYYLHTQSSSSTSWTVTHNLNVLYPTVEIIDSTGNSYTGRYDYPTISFANANAFTLTFTSAVTGYAAVTGGGIATVITPGGSDTLVQYNDGGTLSGSAGFSYTKGTGTLAAGNVTVSANVTAGNVKTNNLLYSNGSPYVFTTSAGGSNTQVQFNDSTAFGGSSAFTFDKSSNTLAVSGTVTATTITETSSIVLKENFRPIENPLEKVLQLVGKIYDRKDGSSKNEVGLVREEVEQIIPELVKDDSVAYTRLTVYLLESIKVLKDQIDKLQSGK